MKLNYKLKLIAALVVLGVSVVNAKALQPVFIPTSISAENSDEWVIIQNQQGINVYFSKTERDGKNYLKIKFENSTSQTIDFSWSLSKGSETIIKNSINKMSAFSSVTIKDNSALIPLNDSDAYADFSFNIQIK